GAGIVSSAGQLFFGGESGFNYFYPSSLPSETNVPPVVLTELKISNTLINYTKDGPIDAQIAFAKEIRLKYGQNFSISYAALNYANPNENQFSYKPLGFEDEWNVVGNVKTAQYTNLAPGEYVFQVRTGNNEGVWSTAPRSIKVIVITPWWRTPYAYSIYGLSVFVLL